MVLTMSIPQPFEVPAPFKVQALGYRLVLFRHGQCLAVVKTERAVLLAIKFYEKKFRR